MALLSNSFSEETTTRPMDGGQITITNWLFDDIRLSHAKSQFETLAPTSFSNPDNKVRLHFSLRGNYSFTHQQLNNTYHLTHGQHNLMYTEGFDMTVESKDHEVETFGIQFSPEAFIKLTEEANPTLSRFTELLLQNQNVILSQQWAPIEGQLQQKIQEILNCPFEGGMKRLYLLSKSIEILVLQAEAYHQIENKGEISVKTATDKEKLMAAREFVLGKLSTPPSLSQVSDEIGLNQYKLKRGFKELFGNTVYGYITDKRLELAQQMIMETQKTASEIAFELGYSSPQHFNNAFKKKFGHAPKSQLR